MKICILLPYANPHVTGWLNEYISITKSRVTVGISRSVQQFRSNYFTEADDDKRYLYLFKSEFFKKQFIKEVKDADVFITLGIFNKDFIRYIVSAKKRIKLYVISEPYNPFTGGTNKYIKRFYSQLLRLIVSPKRISFLAVGGKDVKDYYQSLGFQKSSFYNFGYFPKLAPLNVKEKPNKTSIRFLFIGQLIERKGIAVLKELVQHLSDRFDNWDMEIIGAGDKLDDIKLLCKNHSRVKYLGVINNQEDLFNHYLHANILFLPSYFDGWGAVVNEGLAYGCSLLLSKYVYASRDLLIDGENGFSFDPNDITSLLTKVDNYFYTDDLIIKHSKKSLEIFKVWNHITAATLLNRLLETGNHNGNEYSLLKLI